MSAATVTIPTIEDLVPLAVAHAPSTAESDEYAERANTLIRTELAKWPVGTQITVVYPNGGTDIVRLDEDGDIEAVTT